MHNLELILNTDNIMYFIKILFISIFTLYTNFKILNIKEFSKGILIKEILYIIFISLFDTFIRNISDSITSIIFLSILISVIFSKFINNNIGYSILITTISMSVNYILYSLAIIASYILCKFINIQNDYEILFFIILVYSILLKLLFKRKRLSKGINFLKQKKDNEYFDIMILNISATLFFAFIILSNLDMQLKKSLFVYIVIFSIIMFITIQKSLQLYYKQKLLIKDLEETKEDLENKKQEIKELEKENLNFSKASHSIAHKQKSLEHKINELMTKSEIANEIELIERVKSLTKEMQQETEVKLDKTGIPEIDDMLSYMQSECSKNKIELQLQLSGNIHHMVNHYISKEKLEILLADHIKNAIIAINHSENINKSILVRLGIIEGIYSLYIYDSGIEFEINTLANLGKKPSTTYKEDGGTGIGFMNTFDTLKEYQASLAIHEYGKPSQDNFTKLFQIKFDNKNEFKVNSYRAEEIERKISSKNFQLKKI